MVADTWSVRRSSSGRSTADTTSWSMTWLRLASGHCAMLESSLTECCTLPDPGCTDSWSRASQRPLNSQHFGDRTSHTFRSTAYWRAPEPTRDVRSLSMNQGLDVASRRTSSPTRSSGLSIIRVSDCLIGQAVCHGDLFRMMALRMASRRRMQATMATFFGRPRPMSWV